MTLPLIGVTGLKQHGKDTTGLHLVEAFGYRRTAFADALKLEVATAIMDSVHGRQGYPPQAQSLKNILQFMEDHKNDTPDMPTGWVRGMLQSWGIMKRNVCGEDYWIKQAHLDTGVVVTDVRFPNECAAVKAKGGYMLRVRRGSAENQDPHASEIYVATLPVDFEIENDGTLEDLYQKISTVMGNVL